MKRRTVPRQIPKRTVDDFQAPPTLPLKSGRSYNDKIRLTSPVVVTEWEIVDKQQVVKPVIRAHAGDIGEYAGERIFGGVNARIHSVIKLPNCTAFLIEGESFEFV